jgi:hypothetical protein
VDVDKTGQHSASLQIDFLGCRYSCTIDDSLVRAHGYDPTIAHGQSRYDTTLAVHGDDVTVCKNQIGGRTFDPDRRNAKSENKSK